MKKTYVSPTVEEIKFVTDDIMVVSGDPIGDGESSNDDNGWSELY